MHAKRKWTNTGSQNVLMEIYIKLWILMHILQRWNVAYKRQSYYDKRLLVSSFKHGEQSGRKIGGSTIHVPLLLIILQRMFQYAVIIWKHTGWTSQLNRFTARYGVKLVPLNIRTTNSVCHLSRSKARDIGQSQMVKMLAMNINEPLKMV